MMEYSHDTLYQLLWYASNGIPPRGEYTRALTPCQVNFHPLETCEWDGLWPIIK